MKTLLTRIFFLSAMPVLLTAHCEPGSGDNSALTALLSGSAALTENGLNSQGACNPAEANQTDGSAATASWDVQWGATSDEFAKAVAVDRQGSIYAAGLTDGNLDGNTNSGAYDVLISKFDASGSKLWTRLIGGTAQDLGHDIASDSRCNAIVAGYSYGSFDGHASSGGTNRVLAKFDTNGNKLWSLQAANVLGTTGSVAVDGADNIYLTGYTKASPTATEGMIVVKYDSSGNQLWTREMPLAQGDVVMTDSADAVYVSGTAFNGFNGQTTTGSTDLFLAKYDSNGNQLWVQLSNSATNEFAYALTTDSADNVYVGGHMRILKYNSAGNHQWSQDLPAPGGTPGATDVIKGLAIDGSDTLHVIGYTNSQFATTTNLGISDVFLFELSSATGSQTAVRQFGTSLYDEGWGIAIDPTSDVLVITGQTNGTMPGLSSAGGFDAFLMRNP